MTPSELEIFLIVQHIDRKELAQKIGVSAGDLSSTLSGLRTNHFVRAKLARYFRRPVAVLFGDDFEREVAARQNGNGNGKDNGSAKQQETGA